MDWYTANPKLTRYLTDLAAWFDTGQAILPGLSSLIFRPVQAEDVDLLIEMHQRSSERTIYSRYHSPRVPTRQEMAHICQLDGENGRAVVAAVDSFEPMIVGLAYYIVSGPEAAEPALMVEDRYQGQGVGKQLLRHLTELAVAQGAYFFDAYVLPTNKPMIHLLYKTGLVVQNKLDYGTREIRVQLTDVSPLAFVFEQPSIEELAGLAV